MNIEEIQQAITELSPEELDRFSEWFKRYESNAKRELTNSQIPVEDILKKTRGSLKGSGLLKALMEERHKG